MARPTFRNAILGALPQNLLDDLVPHLEHVHLDHKDVLYDSGRPIEHVFFPETGLVSIVGTMRDGTAVEVATVGNEGFVGLPIFFGANHTTGQAFVQVTGDGTRMRSAVFREIARHDGPLREMVERYMQSLFTLIAQSAACNRLHTVEERFARWLLLCHDRIQSNEFPLTQQFLSQMLGVRRASVSAVASKFQGKGLIAYKRGIILIRNRKRLEQAACECYEVIRTEFDHTTSRQRGKRKSPVPTFTSPGGKTTTRDGTPRGRRSRPE